MVQPACLPRPILLIGAPLLLAACSGGDNAADQSASAEPTADASPIEQRQALLEGMGDAFRAIRRQMEGGAPDFAVLATSAETIRRNGAEFIHFFPAGTGIDSGADTEALASIWEDPEGFAAAHQRFLAASQAMVAAVATGDVAQVEAAVGPLGASCGNCHETYRLDD